MVNRLFIVPGIDTENERRFSTDCENALSESKIEVVGHPVDWDSVSIPHDVALTITDKAWREEQLDRVTEQLRTFSALVDAQPDVNAVLLGHSMGSVFLNEAERRVQSGIPLVYIGSPFSHPLMKQYFRVIRLYRSPGHKPFLFYNFDDDVTSSRFFSRGVARPLRWCRATRIAKAGRGEFAAEHSHMDYLRNVNVARRIQSLFTPPSS